MRIFTARNPCSRTILASRDASSSGLMSRRMEDAYIGTGSRSGPPSSSATGRPKSFPFKSHSAVSTPLSARHTNEPGNFMVRSITLSAMASIRRGSWPSTMGATISWSTFTVMAPPYVEHCPVPRSPVSVWTRQTGMSSFR